MFFSSRSLANVLECAEFYLQTDPEFTLTDMSKSFSDFLEIKDQNYRNIKLYDFLSSGQKKDEEESEYENISNTLFKGQPYIGIFQITSPKNEVKQICGSFIPEIEKSGSISKIHFCATDQANDENEESALKLTAFKEAMFTGEFSADGKILDINDKWREMLGYEKSEIKDLHHTDFMDVEEIRGQDYDSFWKDLLSDIPKTGEYRYLSKSGDEIWLLSTYHVIGDPKGSAEKKVVMTGMDVTGRKKNNIDVYGQMKAIDKSQSIIHFKLDGTILDANENFLEITGYKSGEVKGKNYEIFMDRNENQQEENQKFWERIKNAEFHAGNFKRIGKSGQEIWFQSACYPIRDLKGKPVKFAEYGTDITNQIKAREEAAKSANITLENVENVSASVEELYASVNEVSSNMKKTQSLVEDIHDKSSIADETAEKLKKAAVSMDNIVKLIQDIAGQITLLSLNATIEAARAGDAGKGFAVVASEVKDLATQTEDATNKIFDEIKNMQDVSNQTVSSLTEVNESITNVKEYVEGVAQSIEQQNTTISGIADNMQLAFEGVSEISKSLNDIVKEG
mgnify:CR=1 FL=1